ncbi:3-isopropylmalate dehydratase small subunit [Oceanobacillus jeddahense]|uniref:3-isopropylmalate dehydratase small subunit n=1 Tax=Oceanobacillus jeddahense TaxID=1462527 RepID=A0ABY5JQ77_9BACI|nr:3-isopropylmalate dehydratase small subunit [Oceanobacillus jeddahense]UUI02463.1 3-isopropylmalate dehydratase small subunit [Oceanobacillus jeddahense]
MQLQGNTHVYGNNIDTDRIIPGKYTKTLDTSQLAAHVLEDLDPKFKENVKEGDIIVADNNFGCGSSREQAPLALKSAGISIVIARSFARIFFRNAINIGLPVIEVPDHHIEKGDIVEVDLSEGIVFNLTRNEKYYGTTMPLVMIDILQEGGLISYLKKNKDYIL